MYHRSGLLSAAGCTLLVLVSACSAESSRTSPPSPTLAASPEVLTPRLCEQQIGTDPPAPDTKIVLGAVALAGGTGDAAVQTANHGDSDARLRLFAKVGLQVRAGSSPNITVADDSKLDAVIGWGNYAPPTGQFRVPSCAAVSDADSWLTYAGGIYVAKAGCVTLQVRLDTQRENVAVGVGAPCPGQKEPAAPSDT